MAEYGSGTTITGRSQADIIFRISTGGIFDFVNKAVTNLGWNPPDLIGKPLTAIIHPEHETAAKNFIRNSGDQLNKPMDRAQPAELPVVLVPQEWKKTKSEAACMKGSMVLLGEIASSRYAAYDGQSGASLPKRALRTSATLPASRWTYNGHHARQPIRGRACTRFAA